MKLPFFLLLALGQIGFAQTVTYSPSERIESALSVTVVISTDEEAHNIARAFAGRREPNPLYRYLSYLRGKSETSTLTLPLESILHSFIRKNLNTFPDHDGPNCFNSALCVNDDNNFVIEQTTEREFNRRLLENYVQLADNDSPQVGDLVIFFDREDHPIHVATYIDSEIVFTKNGSSSQSPYIFQSHQVTESIYAPATTRKAIFKPKINSKQNNYDCAKYLGAPV